MNKLPWPYRFAKKIRLLLWLFAASIAIAAGGTLEAVPEDTASPQKKFVLHTTLDGEPFDLGLLLFLPANYATGNKSYPLILFLHGSGAIGTDAAQLRQHHLPVLLEDKPDFPAILVSPQCPPRKNWNNGMLEVLHDLLKTLTANYRIDPDRVHLTGLSLGGFGTWNMARAHPEWFASFASVCGAEGTENMDRIRHIPARAYHGDKDYNVPIERSRAAVEALTRAGGSIEFLVLPGVGHSAWEPAYNTPDLFLWMLSRKRNAPDFRYPLSPQEYAFYHSWRTSCDYAAAARQEPFVLSSENGELVFQRENPAAETLSETIEWLPLPSRWSISPARQETEVKPGATQTIRFNATFSGRRNDFGELPRYTSTLRQNGDIIRRSTQSLLLDDRAFFARERVQRTIPRLKEAPVIDGKPEDAVWQGAAVLSSLWSADGKTPFPLPVEIRIGYDSERLYLSYRIREDNRTSLRARCTKRDESVYMDDCLQFMVQPLLNDDRYYHTAINPHGTVMDGLGHDRSWNSDIIVRTDQNGGSWGMECALSWKVLQVDAPQPGREIGFQFFACSNGGSRAIGMWSPNFGEDHRPSRFGMLRLGE